MTLRRVGILLGREFAYGSRGFIFIFVIAAPIVISLVLTLAFGTLFSERPALGIVDEGSSQLIGMAEEMDSITIREYASVPDMKDAVGDGVVDMGIVLPGGFDDLLSAGEKLEIDAFIWGESLAKDRIILEAALADLARELGGTEVPVEIVTSSLGDEQNIPWKDRLLPFIVLLAVIMGGSMLPATSLVNEKQKGTLKAVAVTPATLGDVFVSKGLLGVIICVVMGVVILVLNQAFGAQPLMLVVVMAIGSVAAASFGVLLGALLKDVTTLFATVKFIGIFLYAPALVYMFPQIPEWVGKIFPTYYIVQPVVEVSQQGAGWSDIAPELLVLTGIILMLFGIVAVVMKRMKQREL